MLAAEFLLQLTDQAGLDLLVLSQLGHRHEDNDSFLALHFDFLQNMHIRCIADLSFQHAQAL
jgi:hypothetical protein